jgi:hypothetical protein
MRELMVIFLFFFFSLTVWDIGRRRTRLQRRRSLRWTRRREGVKEPKQNCIIIVVAYIKRSFTLFHGVECILRSIRATDMGSSFSKVVRRLHKDTISRVYQRTVRRRAASRAHHTRSRKRPGLSPLIPQSMHPRSVYVADRRDSQSRVAHVSVFPSLQPYFLTSTIVSVVPLLLEQYHATFAHLDRLYLFSYYYDALPSFHDCMRHVSRALVVQTLNPPNDSSGAL